MNFSKNDQMERAVSLQPIRILIEWLNLSRLMCWM